MAARVDKPIKFTKDQGLAIKAVLKWLKDYQESFRTKKKVPQVFRLFGYAGTGKTTIAKYIMQAVVAGQDGVRSGPVIFGAFTGKAAARLMVKGCKPSSTIHRLIYKPRIDEETGRLLGFTKNIESPLIGAALCVVDEVSMVNKPMGQDLEEYKVPILVLGDPGQLPPVEGEGYFTQAEPDFMLTEVTRQAADSPIIFLATRARLGETIEYGNYGDAIVLPSTRDVSDKWLSWADQVICGANATRQGLNARIRQMNGKAELDPTYPTKGERLICLKNNHDRGLMNGTHWKITTPKMKPIKVMTNWKAVKQGWQQPKWIESKFPGLWFNARSEDFVEEDGSPVILKDIQVSAHMFNRNLDAPPWKEAANTEQFDFGDCITTHKAQGSEWDNLMLVNESYLFREWARNHLYTGITRAAEKLVLRL